MKDKTFIKKKIMEEEDFIYCPRLGNSIKKLIDKNPDGVDAERIQKVLMLTEQQYNDYYSSALRNLKQSLKER